MPFWPGMGPPVDWQSLRLFELAKEMTFPKRSMIFFSAKLATNRISEPFLTSHLIP
jgi:hypothetical protein